jgi:hypothetical protein
MDPSTPTTQVTPWAFAAPATEGQQAVEPAALDTRISPQQASVSREYHSAADTPADVSRIMSPCSSVRGMAREGQPDHATVDTTTQHDYASYPDAANLTAAAQALQDAVRQWTGRTQSLAPDTYTAVRQVQSTLDAMHQTVRCLGASNVTEVTLLSHLNSLSDTIRESMNGALASSREKIATSLAELRACIMGRLADLEAGLVPAVGRPVVQPTAFAMSHTYTPAATRVVSTGQQYTAAAGGSGGATYDGLVPISNNHGLAAASDGGKAGKVSRHSSRGNDYSTTRPFRPGGGGDPSDDGGDSSEDGHSAGGGSDSEDGNRHRSSRRTSQRRSWKDLQLNTRHPSWDYEQKFGGGGEKDIRLLTALGRWILAFNNLVKVVMPPGWTELRGRQKQELLERAIAYLLPATLKDPALTGLQMMVRNRECLDPRDLGRMVFNWCFPPPTAVDTAEQALNKLTLDQGVPEFEQGLRMGMMVKFEMALWEKPRFQRDHWKEMLMHIRRATEGTGCAANVHWLHTWSTLTDTTVNYELLVTKCLDELTSLEARLGRQCLKKTADSLPQQTQGSAQRGGQRQDGQEGRQSRPQLQLVRRRTGTGRPNRSWKTSPASGGHDLKGPAPPDAPPGCNTLMDALLAQNRCFWCMEPGHPQWECPQRQSPRQEN